MRANRRKTTMRSKNQYKNKEKYYAAKRRQQARHRAKYGAGREPREWDEREIQLLFSYEGYDRELANHLNRSLNAIYQKRSKVRKEREKTYATFLEE